MVSIKQKLLQSFSRFVFLHISGFDTDTVKLRL